MNDAKLTVRLPADDLEFAKKYARKHRLSLSGLIKHYVKLLEQAEAEAIPKEVSSIVGIIPDTADAVKEYHEDMEIKHKVEIDEQNNDRSYCRA